MSKPTVIYKFPIALSPRTVVDMPLGSKIIHVGIDGQNRVCLWAETMREPLGTEERSFAVIGTGQPFDTRGLEHVGTVAQLPYIWHVYEIKE